jgi:predicted DCC family thiol-disulfide oxidoreductase YuxK
VKTHTPEVRGWIGYDAECSLCRGWVRRWEPTLTPRGFVFIPLQDVFWRNRFSLPPGVIPDEMKLLLPDGALLGGAEAMVCLARAIWWLAPPAWLAWLPVFRWATVAGYRWVARHRHGAPHPIPPHPMGEGGR